MYNESERIVPLVKAVISKKAVRTLAKQTKMYV